MKSSQNSGAANAPTISRRGFPWVYLSIALIAASAAAAMGLSLFCNDYNGLDIKPFLVDSPFFLGQGAWKSIWLALTKQAFPESAYYPVFQISLGIDLLLFKGIPFWSALLNIVLHIANAALLFWMVRLFLEHDAKISAGKSLAAATFAGALFAIHPVNVEPVVWVCGRKVLLAFLFSALSILVLARETVSPRRLVLGGFLYLLGVCSNALVLGLPFMAYAYFFMVRRMSLPRALARTAPLWIVLLFAGAMRVYENREELSHYQEPPVFSQEVGTTLSGQFEQALSLIYPVNLSHLYGSVNPPYWTPTSYIGIVFILVSLALIAALWRRKTPRARAFNFALIGYWMALAPTFLHHFARADRHLYFPFIPIGIMAGIGLAGLLSLAPSRRAAWALGAALFLIVGTPLILVSRAQTRLWWDAVVLFEHIVKIAPENPKAVSNLAMHLMARGDLERSKNLYLRVVDLEPSLPETYLNLALIYDREGNLDKAIEHYKRGILLDLKDAKAHSYLAAALEKKGLHEEALEHWLKDLELSPHESKPYVNMGVVAGRNRDLPAARSYFDKALEIEPDSVEIHFNYAVVLENNGAVEDAIERYKEAIRLDPRHAMAHNNLGAMYLKRNDTEPAISHFEKALQLDPGLILARANLALMLLHEGRKDEGILQLREVLKDAEKANNQALANDMRKRLESLGVTVEAGP